MTALQNLRIDKWLWTARFFKTRVLATEAVKGARVLLNDRRVKPSQNIMVGDKLWIRRGEEEMTIYIKSLNLQRRPAREMINLYEETPESIAARQAFSLQKQTVGLEYNKKKPNKKDRRLLIRFKSNN